MSDAVMMRLAAIEARLAALEAGVPAAKATSGIADDAELDSPFGDPLVKKDPKRWLEQGGESYAGSHMSQCPSDYLRMLASLFDWMADKDEEKGKTYKNRKGEDVPTAPLNRRAAAKARGWARRNEGKTAAPVRAQAAQVSATADDEIPF